MSAQVNIPDYVAGTWVIDAAHSNVSFQTRLLGLAKVHGRFDDFEGTIVTAENPLDSSANAVIKTASVNTKNKKRDEHLQQDDFLNAEQYPTMTFTSTGVRVDGNTFLVDGDLTIRAITKQVTLNLKVDGVSVGADGKPQAKLSAHTEIDRVEFGVSGGSMTAAIGNKAKVTLQIVANRQG